VTDSTYFYLLVTRGMCSKIKRAYAGQWILDEHPHNQIDSTYRGMFHISPSMKFYIKSIVAWVRDHVAVMETAKEVQRAAQEARTCCVSEELWGRSRTSTAA
jgi:hypothetical protein